jgi:hypothetical protein
VVGEIKAAKNEDRLYSNSPCKSAGKLEADQSKDAFNITQIAGENFARRS